MKRILAPLAAILAFVGISDTAGAQERPTADPSGSLNMPQTLDNAVFAHAILNQLEGRFGDPSSFRWSGEAWAGTDLNKIWLRTEGRVENGKVDDGTHELFYSRAISTYFNAQIGARYDGDSLPGRGWGAIGIQGLAPLFFEIAATAYISDDGRFAAKLEGSYDLLLTQRLILQPQIEMDFYTKNDREREVGSGLSELDAGLRLRYEITRKFAPYIGVTYLGKFGNTADFARAEGSPADQVRFVAGLRVWL